MLYTQFHIYIYIVYLNKYFHNTFLISIYFTKIIQGDTFLDHLCSFYESTHENTRKNIYYKYIILIHIYYKYFNYIYFCKY